MLGNKPLSLGLFDQEDRDAIIGDLEERYESRHPEMVARVRQIIKKFDGVEQMTFDEYSRLYQDIAYGLVEVTNTAAINQEFAQNKLVHVDEVKIKKAEYLTIIEQSIANPDARLVQHLKNIYEQHTNDKILYDEFYRITQPLVEMLWKRESAKGAV